MAEQYSGRIEQLLLKTVEINNILVDKENVTEIKLYETITQPGITGYIDIMDYQALSQKSFIMPDDKIKLVFSVAGGDDISLEFTIYANEGSRVLEKQNYNVTRFSMCSDWMIQGLTKYYSMFFENKFVHEIIKDLITECGGEVGFVEPTKQKLENFVTPFWTPIHSIKHLLSFATNENGAGGYLCFTDMKTGKVNVCSLDYLYSGSMGRFDEFMFYPENQRYHGRVSELVIESEYNLIRLINSGLNNSVVYGFNYDATEVLKIDEKLKSIKQRHLSTKLPIPDKYVNKDYQNVRYSPLFPNTKLSIKKDESLLKNLLNGKQQTEYSLLASDVVKINILTNGEPHRRAGWLAKLDIPSQNIAVTNVKADIYTKLTGDYLIRDIAHSFSFYREYSQAICLCADGFKQNPRPLLSW